MSSRSAIRRALRELAAARGPTKTFCPSEAARRVEPDHWRELMPTVHDEARALIEAGELVALQKRQPVDFTKARGAIRLRQA